jgi:hypothetical protein
MAYQNPSTPSQSTTLLEPADERKRARVVGAARRAVRFVRLMVIACVRSYEMASTYESLSRLSDSELRRRGLDRATLARDVMDRSA